MRLHLSLLRVLAFLLLPGALFSLFAPSASAQQDPEFRGLWVNSWASGIHTASQIDQLVADAQRGNLNAIFPQVRRRGDAFYDSNYEPKAISGSFDPLAYLIEKAHAATPPIEVHAWIVTYPVGSSASDPEHVLNKHPEWRMEDQNGGTVIGGEQWLDPAHPGVQQHTFNVAMDIVSRYDVDGFHFDYIRYPSRNSGYNPVSVARFNKRYGRSGSPGTTDSQWLQFRRDAVTELVRRVYLEAIALKPDIKISAATIGQGGGITSTSQWTGSAAYAHRLQDWRAWMEEGILDLNMPMLYYDQQGDWAHGWTNWNIFAKDHKYDRHLAIGPGWYLNTISGTHGQIQHTRTTTNAGNRAEGSVGYDYGKTNNQDASRTTFFNSLSGPSGVFSENVPTPEMPWKISPTRGHVKGTVTANDTGQPFEYATVTLSGPQDHTLKTDFSGFYGAVDVAPGTYTLTASMPGAPYTTESKEITVSAGVVTTTDSVLFFEALDEIIIDDTDAGFSGSWSNATHGTAYEDGYSRAWTASSLATATYRPLISIPGRYDIYTWYVSGSNRATNALHTVVHRDGSDDILVNQTSGGGEWQLLASDVHLAGGNDAYVRISNAGATNDVVIADAVRFTLLEADPDPAEFFEEPVVHSRSESVIVTWETVGPAVAEVEYGLSQTGTSFSGETSTVATEHSVTLHELQPGREYQARLHARDGNKTYASNWFTFETGPDSAVVLDNMDAGVTFSSGWSTGAYGSFYGSNYHRSFASSPGSTATFRPNLLQTGTYDVYTWYPEGDTFASTAPYLIQHADGQETVHVDQRSNGGEWRLLVSGRKFTAGDSGYLRITNDGSGHTMADAQRWVLLDEAPIEHTLTTNADGSGTINGANAETYGHGTTVQLTAEAAEGWAFSHWEGDLEGGDGTTSILLYRDRTVTAVFRELFELTTGVSGEGTVEISPKEQFHPADSDVQVNAIPAEGWTFVSWGGDVSETDNPVIVWMNGDKTVLANFGFSYDSWSEATFTQAERDDPEFSAADADPLGHGIPNLLKYAFDIDLRDPDRGRLPATAVEGDRFVLAFSRLREQSDLQYAVEISSDLVVWNPASDLFSEVAVEDEAGGRTERVTLESDAGVMDNGRNFVRLKVVQP